MEEVRHMHLPLSWVRVSWKQRRGKVVRFLISLSPGLSFSSGTACHFSAPMPQSEATFILPSMLATAHMQISNMQLQVEEKGTQPAS